MTLRDMEGILSSDIDIVIVPDNEGCGSDPDNKEDVLCEGKLEDSDLLDYFDVDIVGLEVIDKSTIMLSMDDIELENVVIKKKLNYYKPKVEKMLKEGYTVEQVLGCIYGLYDDCLINEATEEALYAVADPDDKFNNESPGECWFEVDFENPLL